MGINVLSLFDGGSCGQVALKEENIEIDNYFSSEIDRFAIENTQTNFPNTVQIGDVKKVNGRDFKNVDLLLAGSPCQGFSFSGKGLNFKDPRSKLFFEFLRILKQSKPKFWLLENVVMKKEYENTITKLLKTKPIKLDSKNTSAQVRKRLYWSNFKIRRPRNCGVDLNDVLEGEKLNKASIIGRKLDKNGNRIRNNKNLNYTQRLEVSLENENKSNCLTTVAKDTVLTNLKKGLYPNVYKRNLYYRNYTKKERCRLMNLPDNYCENMSYNQTVKLTGNGWEVGMIKHIIREMKKDKRWK